MERTETFQSLYGIERKIPKNYNAEHFLVIFYRIHMMLLHLRILLFCHVKGEMSTQKIEHQNKQIFDLCQHYTYIE